MVFSNLVFLFVFLPIVLFLYFIVRHELKNIVLLLASLLFYAWGEPEYVFLMIFSIFMNYIFGLAINTYKERIIEKKIILFFAVLGNLVVLGYFKYSNFLATNINNLFGTDFNFGDVPLPIGISFFTFQAMSYVIDVYRNDSSVQKNIFSLALYITLFPQLVAGPIVRYNTVDEQIKSRVVDLDKFSEGIKRFVIGLSKKVLVANTFGQIADSIFNSSPENISVLTAWIGIAAYTLQIYFDFSGYSDMAIGLGKMFGFDFLENFNYPYISKSISEFWRRWHISLGTWFKDYVYIPLGGNKKGTYFTIRNLLIVWTITGFWHGPSWTFIIWGFYYGVLICLERMGLSRILNKLWSPFQHLYVLLVVMVGWVFFRADNISYSLEFLQTMFLMNSNEIVNNAALLVLHDNWLIIILGIIFSTPILAKTNQVIYQNFKERKPLKFLYLFTSTICYMMLLMTITILLVNSTYNPFIYFRF